MSLILGEACRGTVLLVMDGLRPSDLEETAFTRVALGRPKHWNLTDEILGIYKRRPIQAFYRPSGEPVAILGINPTTWPGIGAIWLLGTRAFDEDWRDGLRASQAYIASHAAAWDKVGNVVPSHMTERVRWLRHLGFDITPAEANPGLKGLQTFWRSRPAP